MNTITELLDWAERAIDEAEDGFKIIKDPVTKVQFRRVSGLARRLARIRDQIEVSEADPIHSLLDIYRAYDKESQLKISLKGVEIRFLINEVYTIFVAPSDGAMSVSTFVRLIRQRKIDLTMIEVVDSLLSVVAKTITKEAGQAKTEIKRLSAIHKLLGDRLRLFEKYPTRIN